MGMAKPKGATSKATPAKRVKPLPGQPALLPNAHPPKPENDALRHAMYALRGYRCEHCKHPFPEGQTKSATRMVGNPPRPLLLTTLYLDGEYSNMTPDNILVCCQSCNLHIKALWRPGDLLMIDWGLPQWIQDREIAFKLYKFEKIWTRQTLPHLLLMMSKLI